MLFDPELQHNKLEIKVSILNTPNFLYRSWAYILCTSGRAHCSASFLTSSILTTLAKQDLMCFFTVKNISIQCQFLMTRETSRKTRSETWWKTRRFCLTERFSSRISSNSFQTWPTARITSRKSSTAKKLAIPRSADFLTNAWVNSTLKICLSSRPW